MHQYYHYPQQESIINTDSTCAYAALQDRLSINNIKYSQLDKIAEVAELADALASGASVRKDVGVRIPASASFI